MAIYGQKYHRLSGRKANGGREREQEENQRKKGGTEGENGGSERGESLKQLDEKSAVFFVHRGTMASASTMTMQRRPLSRSGTRAPAHTHAHAHARTHINTLARELLPNVYLCINGALTPGRRRNGVKYNAEFA